MSGLNLARFTAVTRGENVVICPSSDSSTCSNGSWEQGWIVFDDEDSNNTPAEAEIIRVASHSENISDSGYGLNIVFEADGTTTLGTTVNITMCHSDTSVTNKCRQISINPFGLISSQKTTAS